MDVTGKRILILGDSLTHRGSRTAADAREVTESADRDSSPGDLLASRLLEAGASSVFINGRVSRSAWNLFTVEDGDKILAQEAAREPDIVFVFLGTNGLSLDLDQHERAFGKIRDAFSGVEVWSIGPPAFADAPKKKRAKALYARLENVFGADRVIDLRPLTADVARTSDGVHFPAKSARVVAARLAKVITRESTALLRRTWLKPVGISFGASLCLVGLAWIIRRRRQRIR